MSDIPPLNVKIYFDASGVAAGVEKVNKGLDSISAHAKSVSGSMTHFKSTMLAVLGGNLATRGFMAIEHALLEAKQEFIDTEQAMVRLERAMENINNISEEQRHHIVENTEAYATLGFQGAESAQAMGTLVNATGDVEQATTLMALAADFARDRHMNLNDAAIGLARATTGNMKAFTQYGITLDKTLPKNQAISKAFDELNARIGGTAQNSAKSAGVQFLILKEKMQSLFDAVANKVLPVFKVLFQLMNNGIEWIKQNQTALTVLAGIIATVTAKMWLMAAAEAAMALLNPTTYLIAGFVALSIAFVAAWNKFKIFRDTMSEALATVIQLVGYLIGAVAKLIRGFSYLPGAGKLKGVADGFDRIAESIGKAAVAVDKFKDKKMTAPTLSGIMGSVKPGDPLNIQGNAQDIPKSAGGGGGGGGGGSSGGSDKVVNIVVYASDTNDIARKLAKQARGGMPIGVYN